MAAMKPTGYHAFAKAACPERKSGKGHVGPEEYKPYLKLVFATLEALFKLW